MGTNIRAGAVACTVPIVSAYTWSGQSAFVQGTVGRIVDNNLEEAVIQRTGGLENRVGRYRQTVSVRTNQCPEYCNRQDVVNAISVDEVGRPRSAGKETIAIGCTQIGSERAGASVISSGISGPFGHAGIHHQVIAEYYPRCGAGEDARGSQVGTAGVGIQEYGIVFDEIGIGRISGFDTDTPNHRSTVLQYLQSVYQVVVDKVPGPNASSKQTNTIDSG